MVKYKARNEGFKCLKCGAKVGPVVYGGGYRNHCFQCLTSRHVDGPIPGDRSSRCGGEMPAIGVFCKRTGEEVLIHRCKKCGQIRYNRVAADDNEVKIRELGTQPVPENYLPKKGKVKKWS